MNRNERGNKMQHLADYSKTDLDEHNGIFIGTKVFYTGDRANKAAHGHVVRIYEDCWGIFIHCEMVTEGETQHRLHRCAACSFDPQPGRRMWTLAEWTRNRRAKLVDFLKCLEREGQIDTEKVADSLAEFDQNNPEWKEVQSESPAEKTPFL
jgi:hypothetical protein